MASLVLALVGALALPVLSAPSPYSTSYPHPANGVCTDYTITEEVSFTKAKWTYPVPKDNLDLTAIRISAAALDGSEAFQPITGYENVTATYQLSGTFCAPKVQNGKEKTVLLATHGVGFDGRYWASSYKPEEYNFVQYALNSGYSIFWYDRLGTGRSQMWVEFGIIIAIEALIQGSVPGYEAQGGNQVEILAKLATSIRGGQYTSNIKAEKIVLVGHSFGSIVTLGAIVKYPSIAEAGVLTGASLPNATDPALLFRGINPTFQNAVYAPSLGFKRDGLYTATADIYGKAEAFFHQPFDLAALEYTQSIQQPGSLLEQLAAGSVDIGPTPYNGSILLTTGQWDILACGGNCEPRFEYGVQNKTFSAVKALETYIHPGAGHGVNFANNATVFYGKIIDFVQRRV